MSRRSLRLRWIATIAFFSINCGPVQRKTATTVEVDGRIGQAFDTDYGCESGAVHRWEHRHVGGSAAVHYESASGLVAGARLRVQRGDVVDYRTGPDAQPVVIAPSDRAYALYAIGGRAGFDGAVVGGEAGVSVVTLDGGDPLVYPYGVLKLGDLDTVWFEGVAGSDDPLHVARLLSIGIGARTDAVGVRGGLGFYGQVVPDFDVTGTSGLTVGTDSQDMDVGAAIDVAWRPVDNFGLTGGLVLGTAKAARVGVSWTFGD